MTSYNNYSIGNKFALLEDVEKEQPVHKTYIVSKCNFSRPFRDISIYG